MPLLIVFTVLIFVAALVMGTTTFIIKIMDDCEHSYERIDTCNDKKMILVCRKCGKIKKLRK